MFKRMSLQHHEIDTFVSKNIQFDSKHGSITFYGINHTDGGHMIGVTDYVYVTADNYAQEVTFKNGSNTQTLTRVKLFQNVRNKIF